MTADAWTRAVFDCNVYFQALISPAGPAGACLGAALEGRFVLFSSDYAMRELQKTAGHPELRAKFRITDERIATLIENVERVAQFVESVPEVFTYERDPEDAHYINLALATNAAYVVSRDKDLLILSDPKTAAGTEFAARFPGLAIVEPPEFLSRLGKQSTNR